MRSEDVKEGASGAIGTLPRSADELADGGNEDEKIQCARWKGFVQVKCSGNFGSEDASKGGCVSVADEIVFGDTSSVYNTGDRGKSEGL